MINIRIASVNFIVQKCEGTFYTGFTVGLYRGCVSDRWRDWGWGFIKVYRFFGYENKIAAPVETIL